jgi:hypothetical protein
MDILDGHEEVIKSIFSLFFMRIHTFPYILFLGAVSIEFFDTPAHETLSFHHLSTPLTEIEPPLPTNIRKRDGSSFSVVCALRQLAIDIMRDRLTPLFKRPFLGCRR